MSFVRLWRTQDQFFFEKLEVIWHAVRKEEKKSEDGEA